MSEDQTAGDGGGGGGARQEGEKKSGRVREGGREGGETEKEVGERRGSMRK